MRKIFTLLIVAILATATSWADTWTWTASTKEDLGTTTTAAVKLNGKDWTVTRDEVNNTSLNYGCIQLGKKGAPEQVTLTTSAFSGKQISSVSISCASYNGDHKCSIKVGDNVVLTEQSTSTWSGDENSAKPISVEKLSGSGDISISFTDGTRALYIKSISVTYTESSEPQKTVKSLAITGEPTNKEYFVGDAFSTDGLKVNATYDDDTQEDVTAKATWTHSPATFTEAGAVSVTATATFSGVSAETTCPVTVKTIANTKETAYTVEQAIALIDAGKDLATPVYVKGIVSEITTPYSTQYKNISFNVSDDGTTTVPQFEFFRNQKDAENKYAENPNIKVGATVIGYGTLTKFGQTYEFNAGNYLVEYTAPAEKAVASIAISGEPTKKEYFLNEKFSPEGLTVTATYDDESTADVTADATWTFDPATFTVVGENIEVAVKAMYKEMEATTTATVSVAKAPLKYSIDLTKDETTTATAEKIEWAKDVVTVSGVQAKGGTAANNYYPGTVGKTYTSTRFYKNSTLTFAPKAGITILSVVYEAASENYANEMGSSTWTNATVKVEGEKVVITPTDGTTTFSAKIGGTTGGKSFTILYEGTPSSTLAELAENGEEGKEYTVNDEMVVAKKFQAGNKNYIVVKDAAQAVRNLSAPTDDDKSFNINGNKQEEYAQNNWMLVSLPVELYNQVNEKSTVTSITGSLTEKFNVAMEATKVVFENATTDFAPNTYCALNFMGESSVKGTNPAYTSSYYFATPKANEYANVVWAVYNGTDGAFYLPVHQGSANAQEFKAAFKVDYSLNSVATPELVDGDMYSFEALVKEMAVATTDAKSAPRKTAYDSTVTPSTKFVVYPLDLDAKKVATGVNDVNSAKEVKGVSYFNMMGVESAQPFEGVNIMVTTYTDGTSSAAKVLR